MNAVRVLPRLSLAGIFALVSIGGADARILPAEHVFTTQRPIRDRVHTAALRPAHVANLDPRKDLSGDTPDSATYFKLTNITAEVHGKTGIAYAVNDDGRIAYTEGDPQQFSWTAYIVNNGGTFGKLAYPPNAKSSPRFSTALALNENAAVAGSWGYPSVLWSDIAWSLSGATNSSVAYAGSKDYGSYVDSINDHDVAVGCDGDCRIDFGVPALFEKTSGRTIDLPSPPGLENCGGSATAINDAGEIVGEACGEAVVFPLTGYAKPLPVVPKGTPSGAEAINQHGDIVGYVLYSAFLYRNGKMTMLPFPPGTRGETVAYGVNARDEVVGDVSCECAAYLNTAFLYQNGHSYTLNSLLPPHSGWYITDAFGVNDAGEIVGDGYYNGTLYGISLKPPS